MHPTRTSLHLCAGRELDVTVGTCGGKRAEKGMLWAAETSPSALHLSGGLEPWAGTALDSSLLRRVRPAPACVPILQPETTACPKATNVHCS